MPQLLYLQGKSLWYPLGRSMGGLQSWSGHSGKREKFLAPASNRTPIVQPYTITYLNSSNMLYNSSFCNFLKYIVLSNGCSHCQAYPGLFCVIILQVICHSAKRWSCKMQLKWAGMSGTCIAWQWDGVTYQSLLLYALNWYEALACLLYVAAYEHSIIVW